MVLGAPTYLQRRHENASEVGKKKLAKRHQGPDEHIKDAEVIQRDSQGTSSSLMNLEHDLSNMHSRVEDLEPRATCVGMLKDQVMLNTIQFAIQKE